MKRNRVKVDRTKPLSEGENIAFHEKAEQIQAYCRSRVRTSVDEAALEQTYFFFFCRPFSTAEVGGVFRNMRRNELRSSLWQGEEI